MPPRNPLISLSLPKIADFRIGNAPVFKFFFGWTLFKDHILATEEGIVTKTVPGTGTAWVKTSRTDACESCTAKGACNMMGGGKDMEVEAVNKIGAKVDDRVVIAFESSSLLKASFLIYLFPVICMIAGALLGQKLSHKYDLNESLFSAGAAFIFFVAAFLFVRIKGNRMAQKDAYRPSIVKILKYRQGN
jgi:sigma-E factor negative regulatory protein RseC